MVSSDYESTHEGNHSDGSDAAHTEDDPEEGRGSSQSLLLHPLIPPEVGTLYADAAGARGVRGD